nr:hypothetical protein [Tanacetum cinerariifolium]
MSPPQPSKAGFPANTVQIEDFHVEGLMVGCGRDDEKPDFRTINHNEVYTLEFNDFVEYSCAFNWKNKHIKFPVYNKTVAKLCDGGNKKNKDCYWRATQNEFFFLQDVWIPMYDWNHRLNDGFVDPHDDTNLIKDGIDHNSVAQQSCQSKCAF